MAVTPALTGTEQTNLSGASTRKTYLAVVPETQVATAQINAPSGLTFPLAQLPVDNTSAGWLNTKKGHTVYIGTAAGASDVGIYRVRKAPSGTTALDIMEIGAADAGALAVQQQTKIADNFHVTVVQRYDIFSVLPRILYSPPSTSAVYEDYDTNPSTLIQYPTPIVNVKINNSRGGHFFTKVSDGAMQAITAVITLQHFPTSTSATYSWTVPAGWTGVAGSTTATLTATAPVGNYELRCTVTPNVGTAIEIVRRVHVYDDSTNPPILISPPTSDTRDRTGRRVTFSLYDDALADIPEGAMCALFDVCTWNGTTVETATTTFVGWFTRTRFNLGKGVKDAEPEMVGPAGLLAMLGNTSQEWTGVPGLPVSWDQVRQDCCNLNFLLWWLLSFRAANLLKLFNYHPLSTAATSARNTKFEIAKGSLLGQLQGLARRYGEANFGCNSGGEFFFARHPNMIAAASRASAVVTRDILTNAKYAPGVSFESNERPDLRSLEGAAFWWDGFSSQPVPYRSIAPHKPGQGVGEEEMNDLIVDGSSPQATLNTLTGLRYAWRNARTRSVSLTVPRNRDAYEPAEMSFVSVTIPAEAHPLGTAWTFNGIPDTVSKRYYPGGATDIELTLEVESSGADGKTVAIPPPGSQTDPNAPPIEPQPLDPLPDWGPEVDRDPDTQEVISPDPDAPAEYGKAILATTEAHVARLVFPVAFTNISPSSSVRGLIGNAILLEQDAADYKKMWLYCDRGLIYTANWLATAVSWRTPVYAAVAAGIDDCAVYDVTTYNAGIAKGSLPYTIAGHEPYDPLSIGTFTPGTGWVGESQSDGAGHYAYGVTISFTPACPLKFASFTAGVTASASHGVFFEVQYRKIGEATWTAGSGGSITVSSGAGSYTRTGVGTGSNYAVEIMIILRVAYSGTPPPANTFTVTSIELLNCEFQDCDALDASETLISDFRSLADVKGGYLWLTKRTIDGTAYVFYNRTYDNFGSVQRVQVARYTANMTYSIAACKHNHLLVYVSAGDPSAGDAYVYQSVDGGGTFTRTARSLNTRGGLLYWNWSTGTPNARNNDPAYLIIGIGLDGSNNYQVCRGISGTPVTVATGSGKYPLSSRALWVEDRDQDNAYLVFQDRTTYKSTNASSSLTWSAVTSVPGAGTPRALMGYPADPSFIYANGLNALAYSKDSGAAFTNIQSNWDTFADATYGAGVGETIVSVLPDIATHYLVPVTGGT
jgi:hypothetical protein